LHSSASSINGDEESDMINSLSPINSNFRDDVEPVVKDDDEPPRTTTQSQKMDDPRFSTIQWDKSRSQPQSFAEKFGQSWVGSPRTILLAATVTSLVSSSQAAPLVDMRISHAHLANVAHTQTPLEVAGTVISWCSTALYLGSRLPQLYKNFRRQSTAGLSPLLFLAAFCGNMFYSTSLITNPNAWNDFGPFGGHGWADADGSQRLEWIGRATPFFLGAAGVLGLDAMMGIQFLMYGEQDQKVIKVRDGKGHSHWERVNGWMRGWIPSVAGKEKVVDLAESQRLLSESQHALSRRSTRDYGTINA
jgi:solute carrier family 66 (lysosomal lysine-arginine transporter), member 1